MKKFLVSLTVVFFVFAIATAAIAQEKNAPAMPAEKKAELKKAKPAKPAAITTPSDVKGKLMVYTSMKKPLMDKLKDAFTKKYPNISLNYYSAGAGKLKARVNVEREAGNIGADVLWTSEVTGFFNLKQKGLLQKYASPEASALNTTIDGSDAYFTPARLATLGIAYNTKEVKIPPKSWNDLLDSRFSGSFGIANPAFSGTAMISVAMLANTFGWDYFEKLKGNNAKIGKGSTEVVKDTASGKLQVSIGVDQIVVDEIRKGAPIGFVYPKEVLVIPSPVAIFKGAANLDAAKLFVDFVLSKEGQSIIVSSGTLPVRNDVPIPVELAALGLPAPKDATKRAMKINFAKTLAEKKLIIEKFNSIMHLRF
ncbi:MAG: iron ABC transporter substrate-binding protein [Nitrospira bacterium HGW-Nitrospira-1]|nr:MAG: iron ABC transporter substrate-binding protein [Nitrospira bacterium HGW-Nitrospira-1]